MKRSTVIIITYSDFPSGSAGAIRYATFAKTYADMGYDVMVLNKSHRNIDGRIQTNAIANGNKFSRLFLFLFRAIRVLNNIEHKNHLTAVIIGSDVIAPYVFYIQKWCRRHNINCVFDATEWYSKEQFLNWRTSFNYWEKDIVNRFVIDKHSRVIAISSYLHHYFKEKGCKVTQVPILSHKRTTKYNFFEKNTLEDRLNIIYAGSHILMDNISLIIEAISILPEVERSKIHFTIYGLSLSQITQVVSAEIISAVKGSLHVMGRRPNCEVVRAYSQSDFSILLRDPSLRVNKAGFPSKVIESMQLGTPVICNYSSDLEYYLIDNENSVIVDNLTAVTLSKSLLHLLKMSRLDKFRLGENAIRTVENKLNSKLFEDNLKSIIV